jgi:glycosyltransferase involved in cell wall biosynthesis
MHRSLPEATVVLICKDFLVQPFSGISVYTANLALRLSKMGETCAILAEGPEGIQYSSELESWIISIEKSKKIILSMITYRTPHPVAAWLLSAYKIASIYPVVMAPIVELQSRIFINYFPGKTIVSLHSPYGKWLPWHYIYRKLQRSSMSLSNFVVGNSSTILSKFKIKESSRFLKIPHEAFVEMKIVPIPKKASLIWIGALNIRKGVDRLIRVLYSHHGDPIIVVYTRARFDVLSYHLLRFLEKRGSCKLKTNMSRNDLQQLIDTSKGILTTSRFESFGLVLTEAASRGRGIVGFRAPGVIETIPENCGGAVYVENINELDKLINHESNQINWSEIGIRARSYVQINYSQIVIEKKLDFLLSN